MEVGDDKNRAFQFIAARSFPASAPSHVLYSLESRFEEQNGCFGTYASSAGNVNSDWHNNIVAEALNETHIYLGAGTVSGPVLK